MDPRRKHAARVRLGPRRRHYNIANALDDWSKVQLPRGRIGWVDSPPVEEFPTFPDEPEFPPRWEALDDQVSLASMLKIGNPAYPRHTIGRFEAIGLRGFGGCGVVYEVYDPLFERNVALKLVQSPGPEAGRRMGERVLAEARALAKISHPNVITVLEIGEYDRDMFFTMEYVNGKTAAHFCRRKPYPTWQEIVDIYLLAGAGLAAAHKAGVIHGDFKPTNILLDRDAKWPRVADFGLAKVRIENAPEDQRDEYLRRGGTMPYMAPEVLRGKEPDARSDLFSFCVALWQSVERVLPFIGVDTQDMLDEIADADPWFTGKYAPELLRDVLRVGLSADPNDRYPDMDALLQAIDEVRRTLGDMDADDVNDDVELEALPMLDDVATAEWARHDIGSVRLVEAEALDDAPTADSERQDVGPVGLVEAEALDDAPTADSERPDDDAAVVEPLQPATSPPPPPKGPGWGPFTAAILFAAVSLAVSASQRLSAPTARGKGVSLLEPDPRLASASACAITRAEQDHSVPAEAEGVCRTIRLGDVGSAARMWAGGYDDRLKKAGGQPDQAFALDSLIVARTFVDQAETFLLDGRHGDAETAANLALEWSTDAASTLGSEHAGVWFVSFRSKLVWASAQSQHSTTPLPSMLP